MTDLGRFIENTKIKWVATDAARELNDAQTSQLGTGVNLETPQVHGLIQQWGSRTHIFINKETSMTRYTACILLLFAAYFYALRF